MQNNTKTIQNPKAEIHAAIAEISFELIENVHKNGVDHINYCQVSRDRHMAKIIFYK